MCALTFSLVNALPLKADPIEAWSESTDLYSFLCDLYDDDAEVVDQSGVRRAVNSRDYGSTLFERGKASFLSIGSEFQTIAEKNQAEPSPFGDPIRIDKPPNFLKDESFGLMAKHAVLWSAVVEALLSESQFFSLPHTLEASEELDCSVLLAKNLYYKQAFQMLRSLLELNVVHVYFAGDQMAYTAWQNGQGDRLQLRGKKMLLERLQEKGAINPNLRKSVDDLYAELNGTIHNAEAKMLHRGLSDRDWAGIQFKSEDFRGWCTYLCRAVSVSVSLALAMLEEVKRQAAPNGIVCDTCRTLNQFSVEEKNESFSSITLRCTRCGVHATFDAKYAAKFGYS